MPALNLKKRNIKEYISGFVDGEGCFSISFSKRSKFIIGWETKPSFSVSQNHDRSEVLHLMQKTFDCGFMRDGITDRTIKYEVRRLDDLVEKIIPHFDRYPLLSSKRKDFNLFKTVCMMMKNNDHKTKKGLEKILSIAFKMNESGRRKYSKQDILDFSKLQMKI